VDQSEVMMIAESKAPGRFDYTVPDERPHSSGHAHQLLQQCLYPQLHLVSWRAGLGSDIQNPQNQCAELLRIITETFRKKRGNRTKLNNECNRFPLCVPCLTEIWGRLSDHYWQPGQFHHMGSCRRQLHISSSRGTRCRSWPWWCI